jgi:hypothetical protein
MFAWACIRSARQKQPLLMLYTAQAVIMLGFDASSATITRATISFSSDRIRRRRLHHFFVAGKRALAMAIRRASIVISSICARSFR